jgi:hypothetical protein
MGLFGFFRRKKEPSEQAFRERRLLPRWGICAPAKIKWKDSNAYVACEVRDLNMKGFSLAMAEKIPDGCSGVQLYFNEKFFFDIEVAVVWHKEENNKHLYGMKFTRLRDSDKEKLFVMMKENFPGYLWKNL